VPILTDKRSDPIQLQVIYPQNRHHSARVRVFVEWIVKSFVTLEHRR
jgi:LysR family transcriptional regulator for bpeEF and oprC